MWEATKAVPTGKFIALNAAERRNRRQTMTIRNETGYYYRLCCSH